MLTSKSRMRPRAVIKLVRSISSEAAPLPLLDLASSRAAIRDCNQKWDDKEGQRQRGAGARSSQRQDVGCRLTSTRAFKPSTSPSKAWTNLRSLHHACLHENAQQPHSLVDNRPTSCLLTGRSPCVRWTGPIASEHAPRSPCSKPPSRASQMVDQGSHSNASTQPYLGSIQLSLQLLQCRVVVASARHAIDLRKPHNMT